jgi:hypothetical protein
MAHSQKSISDHQIWYQINRGVKLVVPVSNIICNKISRVIYTIADTGLILLSQGRENIYSVY